MRTLLTFLAVGSLAAHISEDTPELLQHVKFQSSNFENILTWESGPESAAATVYSVEYKKYGETEWLAKAGCQRITRKSCNLTVETGNLTELYYARVTAIGAGGQVATKMTDRFSSLHHTTIKPPDVTCIPSMRSVQMIIHPTLTPILTEDGHQLTLEDIFHDLFYHLELQVNHTYQMVNHLGGKQREYEFVDLTPDTEFLGTIMIFVPTWSKESAPYVCRVKTLPDHTWTYSFSGAFLFLMGFLVAVLCYLSYRYVTKPPRPPNSLNVQRVLTFQPLRFIQEHVLTPAFDLSGPSSLVQSVQYSQVKVIGPGELPRAPQLHSLPELAYFQQPDISLLRRHSHQMVSPLCYAPQAAPKMRPSSYAPQATPQAEPPFYTPQAVSEAQLPSYAPQAAPESWPPSYGVCLEGSSKDSPHVTLSSPKHPRPEDQLQKEAPAESCTPDGLSLQLMQEPQEAKSFHPTLGGLLRPELPVLHGREPGTPGCLEGQLPLLSSVQIEGHLVSLPLHPPSPPCSPSDEGQSPWVLLESVVCPKDEGSMFKAEAKNPVPQATDPEQPVPLDSLFQGLALTVQWEP